MKKRMEKKIIVTFIMVAVIGIITDGICGVFGENRKYFVTFDTIAGGGLLALCYLAWIGKMIWRHKPLIILALIDFFVIIMTIIISQGGSEIFTSISHIWEYILFSIILISISVIGNYHSMQLFEEDN